MGEETCLIHLERDRRDVVIRSMEKGEADAQRIVRKQGYKREDSR